MPLHQTILCELELEVQLLLSDTTESSTPSSLYHCLLVSDGVEYGVRESRRGWETTAVNSKLDLGNKLSPEDVAIDTA
jgi:hypothetical protein